VAQHPFYLTPPAFAVERPHVEAACSPGS
jgi:hypothetical protein